MHNHSTFSLWKISRSSWSHGGQVEADSNGRQSVQEGRKEGSNEGMRRKLCGKQ